MPQARDVADVPEPLQSTPLPSEGVINMCRSLFYRLVEALFGKRPDERSRVGAVSHPVLCMMYPVPLSIDSLSKHVMATWILKSSNFTVRDLVCIEVHDPRGLLRLFVLGTQLPPHRLLKGDMLFEQVFVRVATDQRIKFGERLKDVSNDCIVDGFVDYDLIGCYVLTWDVLQVPVSITHRATGHSVDLNPDEVCTTKAWGSTGNWHDFEFAFVAPESNKHIKASAFFSKSEKKGPWAREALGAPSSSKFCEYLKTARECELRSLASESPSSSSTATPRAVATPASSRHASSNAAPASTRAAGQASKRPRLF